MLVPALVDVLGARIDAVQNGGHRRFILLWADDDEGHDIVFVGAQLELGDFGELGRIGCIEEGLQTKRSASSTVSFQARQAGPTLSSRSDETSREKHQYEKKRKE